MLFGSVSFVCLLLVCVDLLSLLFVRSCCLLFVACMFVVVVLRVLLLFVFSCFFVEVACCMYMCSLFCCCGVVAFFVFVG